MTKAFHIVAQNIKTGGGKELLIYLLDYLSEHHYNLKVIAYLDGSLSDIKNEKETKNIKILLFNSISSKVKVHLKKIDNALYFGNIPPLRRANNTVLYFHNPYLLLSIGNLFKSPPIIFCKYLLQQIYIKIFIRNISVVACQSSMVKGDFRDRYNFSSVELLPFFRLCNFENDILGKKYDLCYVSLAHPHKNHNLLFDALEILANKRISVSIAVTIENDKLELINRLEFINKNYQNIIEIDNFGVISKEKVCDLYSKSKCLIFPSKKETFGLGLIEAVYMGLDIIASDLEYVYQVVEPSLVFDPNSAISCANTIEKYLSNHEKYHSKGLVNNEISTLINKFIKE